VLKYFHDKGVHIVASKVKCVADLCIDGLIIEFYVDICCVVFIWQVVKKRLESRGKQVVVPNPIKEFFTTEELLDEYLSVAVSTTSTEDVGCSSGAKRLKV
jgi:hypothetical protein